MRRDKHTTGGGGEGYAFEGYRRNPTLQVGPIETPHDARSSRVSEGIYYVSEGYAILRRVQHSYRDAIVVSVQRAQRECQCPKRG